MQPQARSTPTPMPSAWVTEVLFDLHVLLINLVNVLLEIKELALHS